MSFIDRLKADDYDRFAKKIGCIVVKITKGDTDEPEYFVEMFNGSIGPQPDLLLRDFTCRTNSYYLEIEKALENSWRKFMSEEFGADYKNGLDEHLKKQKDDLGK